MRDQKRLIIRLGLSVLLIMSLVALMLSIFGEPSKEAYNTRTITQLQQYMTALELIRLDIGTYPITEGAVCLGDYPDDQCWDNEGRGVKENQLFNNRMDDIVPLLSAGKMVEDTKEPLNSREGYTYRSTRKGQGYEIQYALQGRHKRCGFGEELSIMVTEIGGTGVMLCSITR